MLVPVQATIDAMLANVIATGGAFDPAALYLEVDTAIVGNGVETVASNITAATGAMATRQAVTPWGTVYHESDDRAVVDGPKLTFAPASSAEAQVLVGWSLWSALNGGTLKGYGMFATSQNLVDQYAKVSIIVRLTMDPTARWSAEIVYT